MRGTRRQLIRSEHRAEAATNELKQAWKERLISKGGGAAAAPATFKTKTNRNSERDLGRLGLPARTGPEARLLGAGGTSLPSGSRFCSLHGGGGVAVDD